jgi:hypothetical protein
MFHFSTSNNSVAHTGKPAFQTARKMREKMSLRKMYLVSPEQLDHTGKLTPQDMVMSKPPHKLGGTKKNSPHNKCFTFEIKWKKKKSSIQNCLKNRQISKKIITGNRRNHAAEIGSCQNRKAAIRFSVFFIGGSRSHRFSVR